MKGHVIYNDDRMIPRKQFWFYIVYIFEKYHKLFKILAEQWNSSFNLLVQRVGWSILRSSTYVVICYCPWKFSGLWVTMPSNSPSWRLSRQWEGYLAMPISSPSNTQEVLLGYSVPVASKDSWPDLKHHFCSLTWLNAAIYPAMLVMERDLNTEFLQDCLPTNKSWEPGLPYYLLLVVGRRNGFILFILITYVWSHWSIG